MIGFLGHWARAAAAALVLCGASTLEAAEANPQLSAQIRGVNDASMRSEALRLGSMQIAVKLHGGVAETTLTVRFDNSSREVLQGEFGLNLPRGSVVTGYALDVGGTMVDGVLLDQRQARTAYEARVRGGIDPGLAEVSRDFSFTTHIFPIAPASGRTIRVRFATPLDPTRGYVLPLASPDPVGRLSISIEATGMAARPAATLPAGDAEWRSDRGTWRLNYEAEKVRMDGSLTLVPGVRAEAMLVGRSASGERFFEIADAAAPGNASSTPQLVTILWDRSLSRADDDTAGEIALLTSYLERVRPRMIELILFDAGGADRLRLPDAAAVAARLREVRYVGGSSVAVLARTDIRADVCLLFSDGLITVDAREGFRPACALSAVASGADADQAWLGALARGTGGEAMRLDRGNAAELLGRLIHGAPRVLSVRAATGGAIEFVPIEAAAGGWRIVGQMPASGGVVVTLTGVEEGARERVYTPGASQESAVAAAAALWAGDRLAVRASRDEADRGELVRFARRYSVAGPQIAFLVLETAADYAEAGVEPPASLPAAERERYKTLAQDAATKKEAAKARRLETVLASWEEQKAWWARKFDLRASARKEEDEDEDEDEDDDQASLDDVSEAAAPPPPPPPSPPPPAASPGTQGDQVVVSGHRVRGNSASPVTVVNSSDMGLLGRVRTEDMINDLPQSLAGDEASSGASIVIKPWAPERPYLVALRAASAGERPKVMAKQQAQHGALPAFWLDVSEWHWAAGRRAEALATLLSALELPTRNSETLAIVADRLLRYGEYDRAVSLCEQLVREALDRPQPVRRLALALAARAEHQPAAEARTDFARAIALLSEIIYTPWDARWNGVEMISLMEVNRLIRRYQAVGGGAVALDPRLISLLDVDLRVVIEWNSDDTDIDLWVIEPTGHKTFYGSPRSRIGGHLSDDMTRGFGPEEYFIRRAAGGTYTVRADVYRNDQLNPNGAARMTARLIRDFGRKAEREELIDIEVMPKQARGERLIGRVVVPGGD
jgi:tetratricopeptide (TPR) repeat protein